MELRKSLDAHQKLANKIKKIKKCIWKKHQILIQNVTAEEKLAEKEFKLVITHLQKSIQEKTQVTYEKHERRKDVEIDDIQSHIKIKRAQMKMS